MRALLLTLCGLLCSCADPPPGPPAEPAPDLGAALGGGTEDLRAAAAVVRVHYPARPGQGLSLRGSASPLTWARGMVMAPAGQDRHELRLAGLTGPLEFKPLLDDRVWSRGRNYLVYPGETVDIYPHFQSEHGGWSRRWPAFSSRLLGNERGVWVYLPAGYDENPLRRYPVLYMHDGQNLFDPRYAFGGVTWRVAETLDRGVEALDPGESIPAVIVVGPENAGTRRTYEYTPTEGGGGGGGGDLYLRFLIEELKPRVDAELRTVPERAALCGSSLGGLISAYGGLRHPRVFSRLAALSPSTWWDGAFLIGAVRAGGGPPRPERVYLDSGDSGPSRDDVDNTRALAQAYRDSGYRDGVDLLHVVQAGAQHNERYWAERLPAALRFLLSGW